MDVRILGKPGIHTSEGTSCIFHRDSEASSTWILGAFEEDRSTIFLLCAPKIFESQTTHYCPILRFCVSMSFILKSNIEHVLCARSLYLHWIEGSLQTGLILQLPLSSTQGLEKSSKVTINSCLQTNSFSFEANPFAIYGQRTVLACSKCLVNVY